MGKLAGLGSAEIKMLRQGLLYNPDPKAFTPIPFIVDVDSENYEESWSDGLIMYHNPNGNGDLRGLSCDRIALCSV